MNTQQLHQNLLSIVGPERLITDEDERVYLSQDAFWDGAVAKFVVRPANKKQVAAICAAATDANFAIVPRGGGMSYTRGYVPVRNETVLIDCRDLNSIVEINEEDMYVTVEAGCTWMSIYEALKKKGLRTPYFGPMSGMLATVGGALSQNSMLYGSAQYGTVAESVLGLEVALSDGRLISTGSRANRGGKPFFRHYGPDLTGVFLSDTGALGLKVEAALRLIRAPMFTEYASFSFANFYDLAEAQTEIGRAGIAAEAYGLDPYLNGKRTMVKDMKSGLEAVGKVMQSQNSLGKGLKEATKMAVAGATGFAENVDYSLHLTFDSNNADDASWRLDEARRIVQQTASGAEMEPIIPKVVRAQPFKHVGEFIVGNEGERWIPIHACLPASKLVEVYEATMDYFESKKDVLQEFNISTSHLTGTSGNDIVFEPAFYYPDSLKEFHFRNLEPQDAKRYQDIPPSGATEVVIKMLTDLARIFMDHGAVNQQLGKFYPYREALNKETWAMLEGIKGVVDPKRLMNPGSLGL